VSIETSSSITSVLSRKEFRTNGTVVPVVEIVPVRVVEIVPVRVVEIVPVRVVEIVPVRVVEIVPGFEKVVNGKLNISRTVPSVNFEIFIGFSCYESPQGPWSTNGAC
jgi:hypothetical protein